MQKQSTQTGQTLRFVNRLRSLLGCHLVDGAGHWVLQEQPEKVSALLVDFLKRTD